MSIDNLLLKLKQTFEENFGQTPLRQRNEDILREAIELSRFSSIQNLKEEHGDLLCSLLMSFIENGWDPAECINNTITKIEKRKKQYQAYGRKLSVAIIGGAFDPITNGHIAIAEFLLNFSSMFDLVWFMPCYKHMYNKKMVSTKHRLEMCKLATKHDRRMVVSNYEIRNKLGGETYTLVKNLMNEGFAKHTYNFSFIIGADNANTFDKWVNYKDLENMTRFVVVPRTGIELNLKNNWYMKPPHSLLVPEKPLTDISSTKIRQQLTSYFNDLTVGWSKLKSNTLEFLQSNLNSDVLTYIITHKLYSF